MKVYCVVRCWSGENIDGIWDSVEDLKKIFSTKEKAEKYIKDLADQKNNKILNDEDDDELEWYYMKYEEEYIIQEWEVD